MPPTSDRSTIKNKVNITTASSLCCVWAFGIIANIQRATKARMTGTRNDHQTKLFSDISIALIKYQRRQFFTVHCSIDAGGLGRFPFNVLSIVI